MINSVELCNSEMEYIKFGKWNKVFVIIPGLSLKSVLLSEEAIIASFSEFTDDFSVYLFDRIKDIPENYSIYDMAEDTYNTMVKLWIKSCNIFWASQWWMIAQYIAINHPEFVEKMVLWSTTCKIEAESKKIISEWIQLAKLGKVSELNESFAKKIYREQTLKEYWDIILKANSNISDDELQKFIKLASALLDFDIEKDLWNIKCKTLVLGSNDDLVLGWESSKNLAEKLKCESYIYNWYGHAVYDEAPDYRSRILNFLRD